MQDGTTFRTLTTESPDRDVYLFESRWVEDRGDTNPRGAGIKDAFVEVYANPVTEGPKDRTKYLARPSSVVLPGIHHPRQLATEATTLHVPPNRASVLHIHNITHDRRVPFLDRRDHWRRVAI